MDVFVFAIDLWRDSIFWFGVGIMKCDYCEREYEILIPVIENKLFNLIGIGGGKLICLDCIKKRME